MKILSICLSSDSRDLINEVAGTPIDWTLIENPDQLIENCETWSDGIFHTIAVGENAGVDFLFEAGQVARNQCPRTSMVAIIKNKDNYYPKKVLKNGFNECILLPLDKERLSEYILKMADENIQSKQFKRIKSFDIKPNSELEFDTYIFLPLNKKHIKYSKAKTSLDQKKIEKLAEHNMTNLFIHASEADSFYQYVAEQLSKTSTEGNFISETERKEKAQQMVKEIFSEVFNKESEDSFESGKEIVSMCQKIISNVVTDGKDTNWYNKICQTVGGQVDDYTHAVETSSLSSFFALGMGIEKIDDIAIAAFLHDLGKTDLDDFDPYNPEDLKDEPRFNLYKTHPEKTLDYIKKKRMIVSEKVLKAIANHHEMFNGKGFPKGLSGDRIPFEAQIISLADQFQYLTSIRPGRPRLTPNEAIREIIGNGSIGPAMANEIKKLISL